MSVFHCGYVSLDEDNKQCTESYIAIASRIRAHKHHCDPGSGQCMYIDLLQTVWGYKVCSALISECRI